MHDVVCLLLSTCYFYLYLDFQTNEASLKFWQIFKQKYNQSALTCSKLAIETPEQGVKYFQS